jgi:hypothetical protein
MKSEKFSDLNNSSGHGRSGRLAANRPRRLHDARIAPSKLAQDAQPQPVAALPPLKLVLGQFGQCLNHRVYRSIQLLRHSVVPLLSTDRGQGAKRTGELR